MSYKEKTIVASLVTFTLILVFSLFRVLQMVLSGSFNSTNVFWLWGIVIVLAIFVTILATILTTAGPGILHAIKTKEEPRIDDTEDERDRLIDLRGTRVMYRVSSIGGFISMLTFVFGQHPLVMFTLLVFFGLVAQIAGDLSRLYLYRRGI